MRIAWRNGYPHGPWMTACAPPAWPAALTPLTSHRKGGRVRGAGVIKDLGMGYLSRSRKWPLHITQPLADPFNKPLPDAISEGSLSIY